jgi:hypothetical protein
MTADIANIYDNAKLGHANGIKLLVSELVRVLRLSARM